MPLVLEPTLIVAVRVDEAASSRFYVVEYSIRRRGTGTYLLPVQGKVV